MNLEKRNNYSKTMNLVGIHTLSGYLTDEVNEIELEVEEAVKTCYHKKMRGKDEYKTYIQINPNKLSTNKKLITEYSSFERALTQIIEGMESHISNLEITRADLCINSNDKTSFEDYKKLHRLLICCLAEAYNYKNTYQSYDLWTFSQLNVAVKGERAEVENYNRERKTFNEREESKNRLEFRSKRINETISSLEKEFAQKWCERLDNCINYFEEVKMHQNRELERIYKEDLLKKKKYKNYESLTGFLLRYKDCIYDRKQMIDLLSRFDFIKNPAVTADNFKKKHYIEYFNITDLKHIVKCIKIKIWNYFEW